MYAIVLLAGLAGHHDFHHGGLVTTSEGCFDNSYCYSDYPGVCCKYKCQPGGFAKLFWYCPPEEMRLTPHEIETWMEYIRLLEDWEASELMYRWCHTDICGKRKLLQQLSVMKSTRGGILDPDGKPDPISPPEEKGKDEMKPEPLTPGDKPGSKPELRPIPPPVDMPMGRGPKRSASATLIVTLPAEATLKVAGHETRSRTAQRAFQSPLLAPGVAYHYTLEAAFTRNGKPVQVIREVELKAGSTVRIDLEKPMASVAGR